MFSLLKNLLADKPEIRRQAKEALLETPDPVAVTLLIEELKDTNEWRRVWAAQKLASIGDPAAILPLIELLKDANPEVCKWAGWALTAMGGLATKITQYKIKQESEYERANMYLAFCGLEHQEAINVLLDGLKDTDPWIRAKIAQALAFTPAFPCLQALLDATRDDNSKVREEACRSIGRIISDFDRKGLKLSEEFFVQIKQALTLAAEDNSVDVQAAAAFVLESFKP